MDRPGQVFTEEVSLYVSGDERGGAGSGLVRVARPCLQFSTALRSGHSLTAGASYAAQRNNPVGSRSRRIARSRSARRPPQDHANQCLRSQEARQNHPRPLDPRGLHVRVRGVGVLWPVPARGLRILPGARLVRELSRLVRELAGHPNALRSDSVYATMRLRLMSRLPRRALTVLHGGSNFTRREWWW